MRLPDSKSPRLILQIFVYCSVFCIRWVTYESIITIILNIYPTHIICKALCLVLYVDYLIQCS